MTVYKIRIESGSVSELIIVSAENEHHAISKAWCFFEQMVSSRTFENASITGINKGGSTMEPFHNALEILNDIIKTEADSSVDAVPFHYSTFDFVTYYSISDRTVKRHIMDLKALGCDIYSERSASGHYVWRCRNWSDLIHSGVYIKWLQLERDKQQGLPLVAEVAKPAPKKVCVMNCGPAAGDTRTPEERQASCSDCEPLRVPNRAEPKYHFGDKGLNKPQAR